jgi:hypothetical protein
MGGVFSSPDSQASGLSSLRLAGGLPGGGLRPTTGSICRSRHMSTRYARRPDDCAAPQEERPDLGVAMAVRTAHEANAELLDVDGHLGFSMAGWSLSGRIGRAGLSGSYGTQAAALPLKTFRLDQATCAEFNKGDPPYSAK